MTALDTPPAATDRRTPRTLSIPQAVALVTTVAVVSVLVTLMFTGRESNPSAADVGFYDDMITHHAQAVGMAQVYLQHGTDRVLRNIAGEIVMGQAGEMKVMQFALRDWHASPDTDTAMEWMDTPVPQDEQPGMATAAELDALDRAEGRELDDLFSRLMIDHHLGGIHMADAAVERARLGDVEDLARAMAEGQRFEVDDLNRQRVRLGLAEYSGAS